MTLIRTLKARLLTALTMGLTMGLILGLSLGLTTTPAMAQEVLFKNFSEVQVTGPIARCPATITRSSSTIPNTSIPGSATCR